MPDPISGPELELQGAIAAAVKNDAAVKALLASCRASLWLFEDVPPGTPVPYVTTGEAQTIPDDADCIEGSEIYLDFHIWGRTWDVVKKLRTNLWVAIRDANLALSENRLVLLERSAAHDIRDPDGVTKHGVLTIRALTEPN